MDVDAFLVWGEGRDGRWELRDGQPVMMSPERAGHALTKFSAQFALRESVFQRAGLCAVRPARLRSRGRRFLRDGLNSAPAACLVGAPSSGAPTSQR